MREITKTAIVSLIVIAMLMSVLPTTASASPLPEQINLNPKIDPYLHMMLGDENPVGLNSMMSAGVEMVSVFLETNGDSNARARLEANGVVVRSVIGNIMTANIPRNAVNTIANMPEIVYIEGDKPLQLQMDVSRPEIRAEDVQRALYTPAGGTATSVTGKGVIIGIIDTGIDFTHPDFRKDDDSTRILKLWDQAPTNVKSTDLGSIPDGYTEEDGLEYDSIDINYALSQPIQNVHDYVAQKDTEGHGTHVAGIAAGNGRGDARYKGVAPDADIVVVKYKEEGQGLDTAFQSYVSHAMSYIHNFAQTNSQPCVISISLGTHWGSHDGKSSLEKQIDIISSEGTTVIVAAGNEGQSSRHMSGDVSNGPVINEFYLSRTPGIIPYPVNVCHNIWYDNSDRIDIRLTTPNPPISYYCSAPLSADANTIPGEYENIEFEIISTVNTATSGLGNNIIIHLQGEVGATKLWTIEFIGTQIENGHFDSWEIPADSKSGRGIYKTPTFECTIATPATSNSAITIGSYNKNTQTDGEFSITSSRGPTRDGREKPDISAPGSVITASLSKDEPHLTGYYCDKFGTSMAAPHVAGAVALILQLEPELTPHQVKTRLKDTARTDEFTGDLTEPDNLWGAGKVDALAISGMPYVEIEKGKWSVTDREVDLTINSAQDIGFILNEMRFANENTYEKQWYYQYQTIQSPHPVYPGNTMSFYLSYPDATRMAVHFERIELRQNADFIFIKDSNNNVLASFTGSYPSGVGWTSSEASSINWIEVQMVIHSANSWNGYGFKIDWHGYYTPKWSNPEAFSASKAWTLSPGYGEKTVYCQITDVMGNLYETSDSIQLVEHETSFVINSGVDYTNSNIVGLGNLYSDVSEVVPVEARFSNSPSPSWLYKSNPNMENDERAYWWRFTGISPAINPFPSNCGVGASSSIDLKGGTGVVQPPAEATYWRIYFSHVHLMSGDTLRIRYYDSSIDDWRIFHEYIGTLDDSSMDSVEIPMTYNYIKLTFYSYNNNPNSPFAIAGWEWRNNNLYYSSSYDQIWTIPGDQYAPKVGINFEKIDLGAGDRLTVYHQSGNLLGIFDGPVTLTNRFVGGENNDNIWVRLVSINPNTRGWGIRINGRYVYDRAWSEWFSWPSAPGNWDLYSYGGTVEDGTKHVHMQTRYSDNGLGICDDDIILDRTPPIISSTFSISESSPYLHLLGSSIYYSDMMGSSAQTFTIQGTASSIGGSPLWKATASTAFGDSPSIDFSPADWSFSYNVVNADSGNGVIAITVYDTAGNTNSITIPYYEDNTGPSMINNFPPNNMVLADPTPFLSWSSSDPLGLSSNGYTVQISTNSAFSNIIGNYAGISSNALECPSPLIDGLYYWRVIGTDNVGNTAQSPAFPFKVDTVSPIAQITSPSSGTTVNGIINIQGIATDSNILSYKLEKGWGTTPSGFELLTSSTSSNTGILCTLDTTIMINGLYTLKLTVEDKASHITSHPIIITVSNPSEIMNLALNSITPDYLSCRFFLNAPQVVNAWVEDSTGRIIKTIHQNIVMGSGSYPSGLIWDWTDTAGTVIGAGDYVIKVNSYTAPLVTLDIHIRDAPTISVSSGYGSTQPTFSWNNPIGYTPTWHIGNQNYLDITTTSTSKSISCPNPSQTIEIYGIYENYITRVGSKTYTPNLARICGYISAPAAFWSMGHRVYISVTYDANPNEIGWSPVGVTTVQSDIGSYELFVPAGDYRIMSILYTYDFTHGYGVPYGVFMHVDEFNQYRIDFSVMKAPPSFPPSGGGGGCPYVYAWNGEEYQIDNNIIGKSEYIDNAAPDVTDYFKFDIEPEILDDTYSIVIGETGNEYSIFDSFELLLVDHSSNTNTIVDTDGVVRTYGLLQPPISCVDNHAYNQIQNVSTAEEFMYYGYAGDWLELDFGLIDSNSVKLVLNTDEKPKPPINPWLETNESPGPIDILVMDEWGQWQNVTSIYPRDYWYYDMVDISSYVSLGSQLKVKLIWNSYHKFDFIGLDISEDEAIDIHHVPLMRATDDSLNNMTEYLKYSDGRYIEMAPNQFITLDYQYVEQTKNERDFILISKGYYSTNEGKPMANVLSLPAASLTHDPIYFDARGSEASNGNITGYFYYFGDGTTSGWLSNPITYHQFTDDGVYNITLIVKDDTVPYKIGITTTSVTIFNRNPNPVLEIFQELEISLRITGRKENSVSIQIYENDVLIIEESVIRTPDNPNAEMAWVSLHKYLNRDYRVVLLYDATHPGANPTWLNFTSGETYLPFFMDFSTKNGCHQIVSLPTSYLDDVIENNPSYWFDASGSYDLDGEVVSYAWDFGDNTTFGDIMAEHTYSAPRTYEVALTVTDDDGAVAKDTMFIEVP